MISSKLLGASSSSSFQNEMYDSSDFAIVL